MHDGKKRKSSATHYLTNGLHIAFIKLFLPFLLFYLSCLVVHPRTVYAQDYSTSIYELRYHQKYQQLKKNNEDVLGWIVIPGTSIDYPLLQSNDNEFYLHHDPSKRKNYRGSIFLDYRNDPSLNNSNTIIYGHHIRDSEEMLSTLLQYEDQAFYERNPYIIIASDHSIHYYKIFASYTTHMNFNYIQTKFTKKRTLHDLHSDIGLRNWLTPQITYQMSDTILTLSTCSFRFDNARFVVHAVLIHIREVNDA